MKNIIYLILLGRPARPDFIRLGSYDNLFPLAILGFGTALASERVNALQNSTATHVCSFILVVLGLGAIILQRASLSVALILERELDNELHKALVGAAKPTGTEHKQLNATNTTISTQKVLDSVRHSPL